MAKAPKKKTTKEEVAAPVVSHMHMSCIEFRTVELLTLINQKLDLQKEAFEAVCETLDEMNERLEALEALFVEEEDEETEGEEDGEVDEGEDEDNSPFKAK